MPNDSPQCRRRSIRLKNYDYSSSGWYFITICTHERLCLFGHAIGSVMHPSGLGRIVQEEWLRSFDIRKEAQVDRWCLMPNHLHAIVIISHALDLRTGNPHVASAVGPVSGATPAGRPPAAPTAPSEQGPRGPLPASLGSLVSGFKSGATSKINAMRRTADPPVWQRNYYEHVIRSDQELNQIRQYIDDNPKAWADDEENPANAQPHGRPS